MQLKQKGRDQREIEQAYGMGHASVYRVSALWRTVSLLALGLALLCGLHPAHAQHFTPTGSMVPLSTPANSMGTARVRQTATLLNSGKVLIIGGRGPSGYLASCELYDPNTRTFSPTGNLSTARWLHTATLLNSGKVLVTGGSGVSGYLESSELYDPDTGTFSSTGSLFTARESHTATLLNDGNVLVAGGSNMSDGRLASCELYDPATGLFGQTGALNKARDTHTATLLNNGQVLVTAGVSNVGAETSSELYDPATGSFTLTGAPTNYRYNHTATLLKDGTVLLAGGYGYTDGATASSEIYVPNDGTFRPKGDLAARRYGHTATLLKNGKVLITGGSDDNDALSSSELYDPVTGSFSATGAMSTKRTGHTATLLYDGTVLVTGGYDGSEQTASCEIYNPGTGSFAVTAEDPARQHHTATLLKDGTVLVTGGMGTWGQPSSVQLYNPTTGTFVAKPGTQRDRHTATLLNNGKVLLSGGTIFGGGYAKTSEIYDPATQSLTPTGTMSTGRVYHTATLLGDGKVLIVGGFVASNALLSCEIYDPESGNFSQTGSLPAPRNRHTATLLSNGKVLIAGGLSNSTSGYLASSELYDPATGTFTPTGDLINARGDHTATLLQDGKVLIVGGQGPAGFPASSELYDPVTGTFSSSGALSSPRSNHTATLLNDGTVLVIGGDDRNNRLGNELYDPAAGTFRPAEALGTARNYHTATLLNDGEVLVTGGLGDPGVLASAELYSQPTTISDFSPQSGPVGTEVTITGTSLSGATGVAFNGTSAGIAGTGYFVDSSTQIRAIVPNDATTGKISVITPSRTVLSASDFTVTHAPIAQGQRLVIAADTTKTITLSASDEDNGAVLTYSIVTPPGHGTLGKIDGDKVVYTPNAGFSGSDSFSFKANDNSSASNIATVSIVVVPTVFINNASMVEGNAGISEMAFTVSLSTASEQTVTVNYATADRTTTAGSDYTTTSGTLSFAPNETTKTIIVPVLGDWIVEGNETFAVNLSGGVNALVTVAEGIGTIINDDSDTSAPVVTLTTPANGATIVTLSSISGAVTDTGGSGVARVDVYLRRNSDSKYWIGTTWSTTTPIALTTALSGNSWARNSGLPSGINLSSGSYFAFAYAYDRAGNRNASAATRTFSVDGAPPTVTLTTPANGSSVKALPAISGAASDNAGGSGLSRVDVYLRRNSDNKYWTGKNWGVLTPLPTVVSGNMWTRSSGLPTGTNLATGAYFAVAYAYDKVGNRSNSAQSKFTVAEADKTAPTVTLTTPVNGSKVTLLPAISGGTSDNTGGSGLSRVDVYLRRNSDKKYWNGTMWATTTPTVLTTTLSGTSWTRNSGLPKGANLANGTYYTFAYSFDRAGNHTSSAATSTFTVTSATDTTAPSVAVTTPASGSRVTLLPAISGTASDNEGGSGLSRVDLYLRRSSDNKYWSGSAWVATATVLTTTLSGSAWTRNSGLPASSALGAGTYVAIAYAYDNAGNHTSSAAISTFTVAAAARSVPGGASDVILSSAVASAANESVTLVFTGALNANAATAISSYAVTVDGVVAPIESVSLPGRSTVTLGFGEGVLHTGDEVVVTYDVLDAQGKTIQGQETVTVN